MILCDILLVEEGLSKYVPRAINGLSYIRMYKLNIEDLHFIMSGPIHNY